MRLWRVDREYSVAGAHSERAPHYESDTDIVILSSLHQICSYYLEWAKNSTGFITLGHSNIAEFSTVHCLTVFSCDSFS